MGWLEGEVALVTGGGSGLGLAIVERFLSEGAYVATLDISRERLDVLHESSSETLPIHGDATSLEDNTRAVAETVARFGHLDVLVSNVGMWDYDVSLEDLPEDAINESFAQLFELNVKAGILAAKAALPALRGRRGSIIFSLSGAAMQAGGGGPLYTASKHALVGLVRQLAYELAPEVRVNGVAPSGMQTALGGPAALRESGAPLEQLPSDEVMREWSPLKVAPSADDYAGHYVLLASRRDARVATGSVHVCDAGGLIRGRDADLALYKSAHSDEL
jgi:NAD(P)-dependent dehydrogenase (short-subunit alcohol dehydrogenase family)